MSLAAIDSRTEGIIDKVLAKLSEDKVLVPGARAELKARALEVRRGGPAAKVAAIFADLENPRYLNPDRPSGQTKSFLRRLLACLPITERAAARLELALAMDANSAFDLDRFLAESADQAAQNGVGFDKKAETARLKAAAVEDVTRRVFDALSQREARGDWTAGFVPPLPREEVRTKRFLDAFWRHLDSSVDREELARQWAPTIGNMPPRQAKREIANRLRQPIHARLCEGGVNPTIMYDDPAYDETDEDRADDADMSAAAQELAGLGFYGPM